MHRRTLVLALLAALAPALLLGGCGQKGDLYLPDEQDQAEKESPQQ